MKKLFIAFIASLFILGSCGKNSEEGTHTHDDGSIHVHHDDSTAQEEFNAADTSAHAHDTTRHDHPHPN
jgi:hypothetical protein